MSTMPATASELPELPIRRRSRLRRLVLDLLPAIGISALAAVLITLIAGTPERLFRESVYSISIGALAFGGANGMRLWLWDQARFTARQWIPYFLLTLVIAPVAHFSGIQLGALLLGESAPSLANYLTLPRMSMVVFTWFGIWVMTLLIRHREHIAGIEMAHAQARLRAEVVERQALQAQIRLMQAQIEPHMLFNTLANLQGLIAIDPVRAQGMLDQLITFLRATLAVSRTETTTLDHEFNAMQAYLGLMQVRMGERLAFTCELPPELAKVRVPTMVLQPLVENAIIHGIEPKVDGGQVRLAARAAGGQVEITIRDTGLGLDAAYVPRGNGVGVATTRGRLDALYGKRAALTLERASPQGTLVRLTLPLETEACPAQ